MRIMIDPNRLRGILIHFDSHSSISVDNYKDSARLSFFKRGIRYFSLVYILSKFCEEISKVTALNSYRESFK